ncbi:hypothetical protein [Nocardia thailandica]|uniref:hypothetical protein n=1 Tax=Nocardia thailandica TaxID=257275 RepID=UPI0005BA8370|nr:hypothetical protein [Nocardia thailandica]
MILEVDGVVVAGDGLVFTGSRWVNPSPVFCHHGHRFAPQKMLVGWRFCRTLPGGGHRSYYCRVCGDEVLIPEPGPGCDHRDFDERPTGNGGARETEQG